MAHARWMPLLVVVLAWPGSAMADPDPVDRFVAVIDELSALAETRGDDCPKMESTLIDHVASNERRIARLAESASTYMDQLDGEATAEVRVRLQSSMERFHSAIEPCPAAGVALDALMRAAAPDTAATETVVACEPSPSDETCTAPEGHGFAPERPLEWPIAMAGADQLWFGRLVCADGTPAETVRTGHIGEAPVASTSPPAHDPVLDVVDRWEVTCGDDVVVLYVNTYRCGSLCAPAGFGVGPVP